MRTAVMLILGLALYVALPASGSELNPDEQLGENLFFDPNLSTPPGQSCAACHAPETGYTGPTAVINRAGGVYPGAVHTRFGNRKPPTAAYAGDSPVLFWAYNELWIGGMFWDGRATGRTLGDPLAEQALGPFLNDLEQNMPHKKQVVDRVLRSKYAPLFLSVAEARGVNVKDVNAAYELIGRAIAAYERSSEVNPFSSKYDAFLKGEVELTEQEMDGLKLFNGKGMCAECHPSEAEEGRAPLFTDFSYDNLGIPKNPDNPFYSIPRKWNPDGRNWVDPGLGGFLKSAGELEAVYMPEWGKHKVPTLRNVDKRPQPGFIKAYGHNGYFKSLEEIVHFYNTRDVEGAGWPEPEVAETVNVDELGDVGLTADEEAAIVAFMRTLSDGWKAEAPPVAPAANKAARPRGRSR